MRQTIELHYRDSNGDPRYATGTITSDPEDDDKPMPEVTYVVGLDGQDGIYVDGELRFKGVAITPYEALLTLAGIVTIRRHSAEETPLPARLDR